MRKINQIIGMLVLSTISSFALGVSHYGKKVANVQVSPSSGCVYFTLKGVSEADPVTPGNQWFTLAADAPGLDHVMSLLLMSYATGETLKVSTTGTKVCGYAGAGTIRLEAKN